METEALHCQADLLDRESVAREIAKLNLTNINFVNVSTTDTGNENKLRPYATGEEKKYWLKPETVVERAIAALESFTPLWQEIDVYEPLPGFNPQEYYTDFQKIKSKWQRQTGIR